jgi:hypothetical protein
VISFTPRQLYPRVRASGTHWIRGWVGPRAGLDDMEKTKFLTPLGNELLYIGRPTRSQSLYLLSTAILAILLLTYISKIKAKEYTDYPVLGEETVSFYCGTLFTGISQVRHNDPAPSSTLRQVYLIIPFFLFVSFLLYFILHPALYLYFNLASMFRTTFINLCQILGSYGPALSMNTITFWVMILSDRGSPSFSRNLMPPDSGWKSISIPLKEQHYLLCYTYSPWFTQSLSLKSHYHYIPTIFPCSRYSLT